MKNKKVKQTGGSTKSKSSFGDIYTGDPKFHPGILKAKIHKEKRDSVARVTKINAGLSNINAINKAKSKKKN